MSINSNAPALSVILPTDAFSTIQPIIERLRRQTIAKRLEVLLVAPRSVDMAQARTHAAEFAAIRVLEVELLSPLGRARALGVRAAEARFVFIGETHSYLHPDAAERLLAAATTRDWAAVAPGFENANPKTLFSWAAFLGDYARWSASLPAGAIPEAPLYNALYRRDTLLEMGERLEHMLSHGDELRLALRARGGRAYFESAARIDHVNICSPSLCLHEHFLAGRMIGGQRARRWPWWRRLAYVFAAGLIPFVLTWRVMPGVRRTAAVAAVPRAVLPIILLLNFAKAVGEAMSYAVGRNLKQEAAMDHYEIRKLDYASSTR